jgi:putative NADH-flavin reductase
MQSTSELHVVVGIGPVGRAVIDELVSRGYRVRAVARHGAPDLAPSVDFMPADLTDEGDSRRALAAATVVHHVASAPYHRWPELRSIAKQGHGRQDWALIRRSKVRFLPRQPTPQLVWFVEERSATSGVAG